MHVRLASAGARLRYLAVTLTRSQCPRLSDRTPSDRESIAVGSRSQSRRDDDEVVHGLARPSWPDWIRCRGGTRGGWTETFNLVVARLLESQSNLPGALAAVRRRVYGLGMRHYFSTYLRQEGRLATLTGDRAGAMCAYQHYRALRAGPEPPLRAERDSVRAEVARFVGER